MRLFDSILQYRLRYMLVVFVLILVAVIAAAVRPVPIEVKFRLLRIEVGDHGHPYAWIEMTNSSPRYVKYHRDRYTMVEYCRGEWQLSGVGNSPGIGLAEDAENDTVGSTTVRFTQEVPPGGIGMIQVPLRRDCERFVVGVALSSWLHRTPTEFRSPIFEVPRE